MILIANLHGIARDFGNAISDDDLKSPDGGQSRIINVVQETDALSVMFHVYEELRKLLLTLRKPRENLKEFEERFSAQLSKFNSLSNRARLAPALSALLLMSNANLSGSHRLAILCSVSRNCTELGAEASNGGFIDALKYGSIAALLRLCDGEEQNAVWAIGAQQRWWRRRQQSPRECSCGAAIQCGARYNDVLWQQLSSSA